MTEELVVRKVMDELLQFHSWIFSGDHDIIWMGGFFGSEACMLNALRIAARYGYLWDIEKAYGLKSSVLNTIC